SGSATFTAGGGGGGGAPGRAGPGGGGGAPPTRRGGGILRGGGLGGGRPSGGLWRTRGPRARGPRVRSPPEEGRRWPPPAAAAADGGRSALLHRLVAGATGAPCAARISAPAKRDAARLMVRLDAYDAAHVDREAKVMGLRRAAWVAALVHHHAAGSATYSRPA